MNSFRKSQQTRFVVATALFAAAVISALALTALGNRTETFWVARHSLVPGTQISANDLDQVEVALGALSGSYLSKRSSPVGSYLLRAVPAGELLSLNSVSDLPSGEKSGQVPISIRSSDLPSDVEIGEPVNIYWVHEPTGMEKVGPPELVVSNAYLDSINRKASNFGSDISLTVSIANIQISNLLAATANGRLVIVRSNG
mgnify:CR=1 FL=1|jgi:hypothetical protein